MDTGIYVRREGQGSAMKREREREKAGEDGVSNIKKIKEKEKKVDFLLKGKALCIL